MARRGRQQFQFTVVEMLALAASFTVTATFVFLLGFYVGQKSGVHHRPMHERVARVPVDKAPVSDPVPVDATEATDLIEAADAGPEGDEGGGEASPRGEESENAAAAAGGEVAEAEPAGRQAQPAGKYAVQVLATRRRADAEALVGRFRKRGHDAYVRHSTDAGGAWYRVRVGRFQRIDDARKMAERWKTEPEMAGAWVTRD